MMARRSILGFIAGVGTVVLSGCNPFARNSFRYKITVQVDTPEGVKTGFAVHEMTVHKSSVDLGELSPKQSSKTRGEAVAVDLSGGQTLFVLIRNNSTVINALTQKETGSWIDKALQIVDGDIPSGPQEIRFSKATDYSIRGRYPLFVRFRDINDPKTVEQVRSNDLAASFGPGVKLKRLTVEVTEEDVTVGILERLKWLKPNLSLSIAGPRLQPLPDRGTTKPTFGQSIAHGAFRSGFSK
jgi:hypothetical protein